ncbi:putative GYF domain containing protein [Lyophyllum shimeji]|uniref:GYF domain containing protein n=1 Tax=Lyophyllum shimeji TaxID=47721 RepID=A0A9P3UIZ5_LYOSH|nr:putative GYF domain containing protein [Lyophyllum shimeji]
MSHSSMQQRSSQKRAAASNGGPSSSKHAVKKTRFVDPSEDPARFAEEVDSNLETTRRRGQVKTVGYESDSSDDGEGVVRSRKKAVVEEDENDDMFAIADKEEKKEEVTGKKKKEQFLRLGDIEGQEFGGSASEDEDEDDEPEDEDDAERRKKAGMGYELSSFNMRDEMEEGKFTDDGTYVRTFDPHAAHDRWMEGWGAKEIKLARRRKRQQEKEQQEKMAREEKELEEMGGKGSLEQELLAMLKKGETVLEALQRLGNQAKKNQAAHKTGKAKPAEPDAMNVDKPVKQPTQIETITHLASNLMALGDTDIYSKTYEELVRSVRSSGAVDASWHPPSADVRYEYKWDIPGGAQSGEVFGPFSEQEMLAWMSASYFGPSGEKVKIRATGGEWGDWHEVLQ